jgi:hypothetical protein
LLSTLAIMTKSKGKRNRPTLEELLERPWCFYCNKDFDDLKILVDHQKAKHYKCQVAHCNRRLNTVGGLRVHMQQVHKEELKSVPNVLEDRDDVNLEIFGMEGIPAQMRQAYNQQVTQAYYKQEAEHRARTGNNLHSAGEQPAAKKLKLDDDARAELKKRVAEAKAKREAQKAAAAAGLPMPAETASPAPPPNNPSPVSGGLPVPPPGMDQLQNSVAGHGTPSPIQFQNPIMPTYGGYNQQLPPGVMPQFPPGMPAHMPPGMPAHLPPGMPPHFPQLPGQPHFHALPHAVSPPGWGARPPNFIPAPVNGGLPTHFPANPSLPPNNALPGSFSSSFAPPPGIHGLPPNLPARPGPPMSHNLPANGANFDLNRYVHRGNNRPTPSNATCRLMDEQSKIALDRLNGPSAATETGAAIKTETGKSKQELPEPSGEKPAKASKKKQPTKLVLSDNEVSWEEHRAALTRYQRSLVSDVATAPGEATDNATGPVEAGATVAVQS